MPSQTFCLTYAELMQQYQFIEEFLERLYAVASGKVYYLGLQDVDKSPLPSIIRAIHQLETEQKRSVFTEGEYSALSELIKRRNFWAHECFVKLVFDDHTGRLKRPEDMHRMVKDLHDAKEWREKLFAKQLMYFK